MSSLTRLGLSVYLQYLQCEERLGQRGSTGYRVQGGTYDWESIMGAWDTEERGVFLDKIILRV